MKTIDVKGGKTTQKEAQDIKDARAGLRASKKKNPKIVFKKGESFGRTVQPASASSPPPATDRSAQILAHDYGKKIAATMAPGDGALNVHKSVKQKKLSYTNVEPKNTSTPGTPGGKGFSSKGHSQSLSQTLSDLGLGNAKPVKVIKPKKAKDLSKNKGNAKYNKPGR